VAVGGHGCDHEFVSVLIRLFRPPILGRNSNGTIAKLAAQVGHNVFLFYLLCIFTGSLGLCPL
jgi:hypothetical protein